MQSGSWHRKRLRPWRKPDPGPPGSSSWSQSGKPRAMPACRRGLATGFPSPAPTQTPSTRRSGASAVLSAVACAAGTAVHHDVRAHHQAGRSPRIGGGYFLLLLASSQLRGEDAVALQWPLPAPGFRSVSTTHRYRLAMPSPIRLDGDAHSTCSFGTTPGPSLPSALCVDPQ